MSDSCPPCTADGCTLSCAKHEGHLGQHTHPAPVHVWGFEVPITPKARKPRAERLKDILSKVQVAHTVGKIDPDDIYGPRVPIRGVSAAPPVGGIPQEAIEAWRRDDAAWLREASKVLFRICMTTPEFTTEVFWPQIVAPREKRMLSTVVRGAIDAGWITEISAKRVRGSYRSLDGQEFKLNKLVPIYRSNVVQNSSSPSAAIG